METVDALVAWILLGSAAALPWLIARLIHTEPTWRRVLAVYLVSLVLGFVILAAYAYWPHFFTSLRLELLGYDQHGFSEDERLAGVAPENREGVTHLLNSIMGIGWPLRLIVVLVIYVPYSLIACLLGLLLFKSPKRPGTAA